MRDWFESHSTLLTFPFSDLDTELEEKIINFEHWFELYLRDEEYYKDQQVKHFASKYHCSRVMAWIWMNSEYIKDHEVADCIKQAGELFHEKNGICAVYSPDQCKKNISASEKAIFLSFRALARPRAVKALMESQREIVPPAEVPHTNDALDVDTSDDEPGAGNNSANI